MKITASAIQSLGVGYKSLYEGGLGQAPTDHLRVATRVPSSTGKEEFGWLGKIPNVREWIGDRVVQNIRTHDYTIKNKDFELTVAVDRNDIQDDNLGIYAPLFTEMGMSTGAHACRLVFELLKAGFSTACYDGQYFFDTDHPVLDANGAPQSVANTDGGSGAPWFLIDSSRALKPILWQVRKDWEFVARDKIDDDNVFSKKEFVYGSDSRMNVGFGFWQFAWGSKQALTAANLKTAFEGLEGMKGDYGRPLGIRPNLFIGGPTHREAAQKLFVNDTDAAGAANPWKGTAEVFITPWLA